jgi:hypothetical protein
MESHQSFGDRPELMVPYGLRFQANEMVERTLSREAPHHHAMLENLAFQGDYSHTQIDIRCQPAVQFDFSPTVLSAGSWRREVGKIELKRLVEFEDTISEKQQDRYVGLSYATDVGRDQCPLVMHGASGTS